MSNYQRQSLARSQGSPAKPQRLKPRSSRSVDSPVRSGRLLSIPDRTDRVSFGASPLGKTVLSDKTEIEMPRRKSWWKKVENSRDMAEILRNEEPVRTDDVFEDFGVELLTNNKNNYLLDIPESSGSESIHSIIVPQRKLFVQKENNPQNKFEAIAGTSHDCKPSLEDQTIHVGIKKLFGKTAKKTTPIFPSALLNLTNDNTIANKTKELPLEVKSQAKRLFGNGPDNKRKNIFADLVVSESEEEILDIQIQPRRFTFNKPSNPTRRSSNASSFTTDIELDEWKLLPSSTMMEHQFNDLLTTPGKRARLSKLAEAKESTRTNSTKLSNKSELSKNRSQVSPAKIENEESQAKNISKHNLQDDIMTEKNKTYNKNKTSVNNSKEFVETNEIKETSYVENKNYNINKTIPEENPTGKFDKDEKNKIDDLQENAVKEQENKQVESLSDQQDDEIALTYEDDIEINEASRNVIDNRTKTICVDNRLSKVDEYMDNLEEEMSRIVGHKAEHILQMETPMPNKSAYLTKRVVEETPDSKSEERKCQNNNTPLNELPKQDEDHKPEEAYVEKDKTVIHNKDNFSEKLPKTLDNAIEKSDQLEKQSPKVVQCDSENGDAEKDLATDYNNEGEVSEDEIEASDQDQAEAETEASNQEETEAEQELEEDNEEQNELETGENIEESEEESNDNNEEIYDDEQEVSNEIAEGQEMEVIQGEDEEEMEVDEEEIEEEEEEVQNESQEMEEEVENESMGQEQTHEQDDSQENEDENNDESQENAEEDDNENNDESHENCETDHENECQEVNESNQEIEDNIQINEPEKDSENELQNMTHDTTGRNRKKRETNTPEAIRNDLSNKMDSFTAKGLDNSTKTSKSIVKNFMIRQSLVPTRESAGSSDGTKNSSAEGSGWDSHRTTRKTLRQTFGKDFTPRKSLRALVMEKSAKRQTMLNEANAELKNHQANSTELPNNDDGMDYEDVAESDHEASRELRQTKLDMYMQKIQKENMELRQKIAEEIRNPPKSNFRANLLFFKPNKTIRRRADKSTKPVPKVKRVKPWSIPLENLPPELVEDMKYRPPKRFKPTNASWITKRLYKFLETKLEPKYDYKARIRAEKLVQTIYNMVRDTRRIKVAPAHVVAELKREMARLDIVHTHFEFYDFVKEYLPYEAKIKIVPDIINDIPLPSEGIFAPIII